MKDEESKKPLELEDEGGGAVDSGSGLSLGLCFGAAFGLLAQLITGDAAWLPLGAAVGFGLGYAIGSIRKSGK